jgi:thioredoxin reductase/Fe-S-cluster-containing hydrogenase component 2
MRETDVLIIGGGPAGLSAAIECGKSNVDTMIIDDGLKLGGQLIKQTHKFFGSAEQFAGKRGIDIARDLIDKVKSLDSVTLIDRSTVLALYDDGIAVYENNGSHYKVKAKKIIVATGAKEKMLLFENSDLPGVYGAGAVQTLMNVYGVKPGERALMVGAGNVGLIVAYQLLQAGVNVVGIVEASDHVGGYKVHADKIERMGIPVYLRHTITKVDGPGYVEKAIVAEIDENWKPIIGTERIFDVDVVCIAVGLSPLIEILGESDVDIRYIPELGGYVPIHDENMKTSNDNIYVAGDASSIEEATSAILEGRIAAINVLKSLDKSYDNEILEGAKKELEQLRAGPVGIKIRSGLSKMYNKKWIESAKDSYTQAEYDKFEDKKVAVIECFTQIPCNPCEANCPTGAIKIGKDINMIPKIDLSKCIGCEQCVLSCPGLAIRMIHKNFDEKYSLVSLPYELLPLPQKGDRVALTDERGKIIGYGEVHSILNSMKKNKTNVVRVKVLKNIANMVKYIYSNKTKSDIIVCRCEQVSLKEIEDAIDAGYTEIEELKRYLRLGMGPCGGKNCIEIAMRILQQKTGKKLESIPTKRPPVRPIPFSIFLNKD